MSKELEQFQQDAETLRLTHSLADYAEQIAGTKDVAVIMIGAAIRIWKRQHGDEHALHLAKLSLQAVINGLEHPSAHN